MQCAMSVRGVQPWTVLPKRGLDFFFFFLPESCHHAFWLFLVSFAMLKGKKEQIFFFCFLLELRGASSSTNWFLPLSCYFKLPEGACLVTKERLQAVLSCHMNGSLLSLYLLKHFCPTASTYHQATPSETCASALSVQQMPCFNWNKSKPLQGMEFILTIRNVCFSLPHFAKKE